MAKKTGADFADELLEMIGDATKALKRDDFRAAEVIMQTATIETERRIASNIQTVICLPDLSSCAP